jgi:hypothetical protein
VSAEDRVRYWRDRALRSEQETSFYKRDHDLLLEWFNERISRERRLEERCTFLYGEALARGATREDLAADQEVAA